HWGLQVRFPRAGRGCADQARESLRDQPTAVHAHLAGEFIGSRFEGRNLNTLSAAQRQVDGNIEVGEYHLFGARRWVMPHETQTDGATSLHLNRSRLIGAAPDLDFHRYIGICVCGLWRREPEPPNDQRDQHKPAGCNNDLDHGLNHRKRPALLTTVTEDMAM